MEYKVTALQDVTIRAYVFSGISTRPSEQQEWVSPEAGEVRDGLGLVLGVHPKSLPGETPTEIEGVRMMLPSESWSNADLPKEFFGLYRLEYRE